MGYIKLVNLLLSSVSSIQASLLQLLFLRVRGWGSTEQRASLQVEVILLYWVSQVCDLMHIGDHTWSNTQLNGGYYHLPLVRTIVREFI